MFKLWLLPLVALVSGDAHSNVKANEKWNYEERDGLVIIEGEHFASQHLDQKRRWLTFNKNSAAHDYNDADRMHYQNASNGAYIELLPDTRVNHHDVLVHGENFSAHPGTVAVLSYPVHFSTPGRYYVWARAFSTGSEDNGLHIGLNNIWPESGQRLQLCDGKDQWTWSSAQRVEGNHCGVPNSIALDVPAAGVHNVMVSMREDGFELDKLVLTTHSNFIPQGQENAETLSFKPELDKKKLLKGVEQYHRALFASRDFTYSVTPTALSIDQLNETVAINRSVTSSLDQYVSVRETIGKKDAGTHELTLVTLSEGQAQSRYQVRINGQVIAVFTNPKSEAEGSEIYFQTNEVTLKQGDIIEVACMALSQHGPQSQGRWRALVVGTQ
ncbi:hypothetical protein [Echinimonas agarilytica]|uniref:Gylcosyl hydrolase 115 C-terminal domain-containing protein n=1 Tax=Echinimonas agarilytica TaxID=1215918 RepID=A0AA42B898_9GAMM|nr:hypothetical protein [Echinimonas agarilytica]MCM2680679.1 hypothetical protein [Echinimonas agarilytica]